MEKNKICEICGSSDTREVVGDNKYAYKGHEIIIPNYKKIVCNHCGLDVADPVSVKASVPLFRDAQRKIDGFLTSAEIKAVRTFFGMSQKSFSEILGGGAKGFARYENGSVLQSKPMDNLLRILRALPEALIVLLRGSDEATMLRSRLEITQYSPLRRDYSYTYQVPIMAADDMQDEKPLKVA